MRALLAAGADLRIESASGRTALAWARQLGTAECVQLLESAEERGGGSLVPSAAT